MTKRNASEIEGGVEQPPAKIAKVDDGGSSSSDEEGDMMSGDGFRFYERAGRKMFEEGEDWTVAVQMKDGGLLDKRRSKFQTVFIMDTIPLGRILVMDGAMQCAQYDEFIYHESLIHPSMLAATEEGTAGPKRVFIAGGADMAAAREVLRWKSVEEVIVVDIDQTAVDMCKERLQGAFRTKDTYTDKRLTIIIDDAYKQIFSNGTFDVIIMDLVEPSEGGPANHMYYKEFYQKLCDENVLKKGGALVTQAGDAGFDGYPCEDGLFGTTLIHNTMKAALGHCSMYSTHVDSFCGIWGWCMIFNNEGGKPPAWFMNPAEIDKRLGALIDTSALRHYDGQTHMTMFLLPKYTRDELDKETNVMTKGQEYCNYRTDVVQNDSSKADSAADG